MGLSLRVAWLLASRQILRSSKWTTGLIIFIMVLTFLNLVVVSGLLVGLITGSYKQFRENYSGDIIITPLTGATQIENSQEFIKFLEEDSRVDKYSARYTAPATVKASLSENPKNKEKANIGSGTLVGINPTKEEELTKFSQFLLEGENLDPDVDGSILIGANLIKKYSSFGDVEIPGLELLKDVEVGSKVRVSVGTGENQVSKDMFVRGILKSKVDQISQRMFILDSEFRRLLPTNQWEVNEIAIKAVNPLEIPSVVNSLQQFSNNKWGKVQASEDAIPSFLRDIETTFGILGNALSSIALVVASITVFIVIFINAITRRKFIGIMKGIGVEPLAIKLAYVMQGLFYGIIGSSIGLALTFGLLKPFFDANPIDFPFSDGILVATPEGAAIRVLILLFVTVCAGYIPAALIVRKNTLDSILGR